MLINKLNGSIYIDDGYSDFGREYNCDWGDLKDHTGVVFDQGIFPGLMLGFILAIGIGGVVVWFEF